MDKKIALGFTSLAIAAGIAGAAISTTYAKGGPARFRGSGMMHDVATSTAAMTAQRDAMLAVHDAMEKAVSAGDYAAWKAAADKLEAMHGTANGKAITSVITEANFAKFVEMHALMQRADAIRKELGLDQPGGDMRADMMHEGRGRGMMGYRLAPGATSTVQ